MAIKLHYGLLSAGAFSSLQTPVTGYTVSNTSSTEVRKPWVSPLSANSVNSDWIEHDYGSSKTIAAICLQSMLQSSGTVLIGTVTPPATTYGTVSAATVATDRHGIRKGSFTGSATARYVRLNLPAAVDARTTGVFSGYSSTGMELGSLYVFGSTLTLPISALIGPAVGYDYPEGREVLPNLQTISFQRGAPRAKIRLDFLPSATQDIEQAARIAKDQLCWLDLGVAGRPELQWPVRFYAGEHNRDIFPQTRDRLSLAFEEIT